MQFNDEAVGKADPGRAMTATTDHKVERGAYDIDRGRGSELSCQSSATSLKLTLTLRSRDQRSDGVQGTS